jgi:hypothetical protein
VTASDPHNEDEGILDQIDDAVDTLMGEHLPKSDREDPWERRTRVVDGWAAVILGIAAVAATWTSYQSGQWSDAQADAQAASTLARTDAARAATDATTAEIVDTETWLAWVSAVNEGDQPKAVFLSNRFSEPLKVAQRAWLGSTEVNVPGVPEVIPPGTPMDLDAYVLPEQVASDVAADEAEALLEEAAEAGENSRAFVMVAVLLAVVLFFAGVASKFRAPKLQVALVGASVAMLVFSLVRMLTLPQLL